MRWPRTRITVLAVPMVAFTIALYVGNALAPTLIKDAPVLLLVLAPKIRWLLLISNEVDALTFFLVPLARATAVLTVYFLLGHWYGDRSLRWLEQRTGNALRPGALGRAQLPPGPRPGDVPVPGQRQRAARRRRRHAGRAVLRRRARERRVATLGGAGARRDPARSDPRGRAVDRRQPAVAHRRVGGRRDDLGRVVEPARAARAPRTPSTRSSRTSRPAASPTADRADLVRARPTRARHRPSRNRSGPSSPSTTSAMSRPTSGANLKPWPEHGDATTTGPTRSMTKSSVAVVV